MSDLSSPDKRVRAARVRELAKGVDQRAARALIEFASQLEADAAKEERLSLNGPVSNQTKPPA